MASLVKPDVKSQIFDLPLFDRSALNNSSRSINSTIEQLVNSGTNKTISKVQDTKALALGNSTTSNYSVPLNSTLVSLSDKDIGKNPEKSSFPNYLLGMPFLRTSFNVSAGHNANASDGILSNIYSGAKTTLGYAWNNLGWETKVGLGVVGALGVAYLVHKYWKNSGVHITNNNTNSAHFSLKGEPGIRVTQEEKDGKVFYTVEEADPLVAKIKRLIQEKGLDVEEVLEEVKVRRASATA